MILSLKRSQYFSLLGTRNVVMIIIVMLTFTLQQNLYAKDDLTQQERLRVIRFAEEVPIEDSVGQLLMVGFPDVFKEENFKDMNVIKLIQDYQIGNIFIRKNNFESPNIDLMHEGFHLIKSNILLKLLHRQARNTRLKIPLFLAAYCDGPRFTSIPFIEDYMSLPGLTLASTNDRELIKQAGHLLGEQLKYFQVNTLIGPHIDCDKTTNGYSSKTIVNQLFGGTRDIVYHYVRPYIEGLQKSDIVVFGKFIPGKGSIEYLHKYHKFPEYYGRIDNYLPRKEFNILLNGIMTSHANIPNLNNEIGSPIVTVSNTFIDILRKHNPIEIISPINNEGIIKIDGLGYENQVLITDDLSQNETIQLYRRDNRDQILSFGNLAVEAFKAGHDILFFSEVKPLSLKNPDKTKSDVSFYIDDINEVIKSLITHINGSEESQKKFRKSLKRILLLKAKQVKNKFGKFDSFSENIYEKTPIEPDIKPCNINELIGKTKFKNSSNFVESLVKESMILVNYNGDRKYDISDSHTQKFVFYIDENHIDLFKESFVAKPQKIFVPVPRQKESDWLKNQQQKLLAHLSQNCCVIYTVLDAIDMKLLSFACSESRKNFRKKVIILLHTTPKILEDQLLSNATIVGCFTWHPLSYKADIALLNKNLHPKDNRFQPCLTISLGKEGQFYTPPPPDEYKKKQFDRISREFSELKIDCDQIEKKNIQLQQDLNQQIDTASTLQSKVSSLEGQQEEKSYSINVLKTNKEILTKEISELNKSNKKLFICVVILLLYFIINSIKTLIKWKNLN